MVERRPEKAGVASSILAPGTIRSRHRFFSGKIYFAMSEIHRFAVLNCRFEGERSEVFCKHCMGKVNTFGDVRLTRVFWLVGRSQNSMSTELN